MTDTEGTPGSSSVNITALSNGDVTSLMSLITSMLVAMEHRIIARLDANSLHASERWAKHDAELLANTKRVVDRFEKLERELATLTGSVNEHFQLEHDERVRTDARVKPLVGSIRWIWLHWRDIVLLAIGLAALFTFVIESAREVTP